MIHLLTHVAAVHDNLPPVRLIERALVRGEARLGNDGQLCVLTGTHTDHAAADKYIVIRDDTARQLAWGPVGQPLSPDDFEGLKDRVIAHLSNKEVYVVDFTAGPARCRLVTEFAWQALFARNMFKAAEGDGRADLLIVSAPSCEASPTEHNTRSGTFIALDLTQGLCLIGGTGYAGEIKRSVFTYLSWLLPPNGIMPVHASVSTGRDLDDVALFFGPSGTGKTTLSARKDGFLLGDDGHGWGSRGIFNLESGCYTKAIRLTSAGERITWDACHSAGTVLENVDVDAEGNVDFDSARITENTRAAYPLSRLPNAFAPGTVLTHPRSIIMLTCDAFGVLPSCARLSPAAAIYHFLSGYASNVAGTERGITEPTVTFNTCFGAAFMPHHPHVYAELLARLIDDHAPRIYLVNTGWSGGPPGVGRRMKLDYTRELVDGILRGEFDSTPTRTLMPFNLQVPIGLPDEDPRSLWEDPDSYDAQATLLAQMFVNNFQRFSGVPLFVAEAGPRP